MYLRRLLDPSFRAIKTKYFFSTVKQNEPTWDLMRYRYFVPVQTRFRDNDIEGHLYESVYYNMMLSITDMFVTSHTQNVDEYKQLLVANHCNKRANLCYPQSIIAGLGVKQFDEEKIKFECAFFRGNPHSTDFLRADEGGIPLNGCLLENEQILKLLDSFEQTASIVCGQTLKFESETSNGLTPLPVDIIESIRLLEADKQ